MPNPVPTPEQYEKAAREYHAKAKPGKGSPSIKLARRIILSIFVPLVSCLFTYSLHHQLAREETFNGVRIVYIEWHKTYLYWPLAASLTGVFLWFLWGPSATIMNLEIGQDSEVD